MHNYISTHTTDSSKFSNTTSNPVKDQLPLSFPSLGRNFRTLCSSSDVLQLYQQALDQEGLSLQLLGNDDGNRVAKYEDGDNIDDEKNESTFLQNDRSKKLWPPSKNRTLIAHLLDLSEDTSTTSIATVDIISANPSVSPYVTGGEMYEVEKRKKGIDIRVCFTLPCGVYATCLLRELLRSNSFDV